MTDEERVLKNIKYIIKQNYVDTEDDIMGILISASNLIKKQSKEIEELKEKDSANLAYYDQIYQNGIYTGQKAVENKIKAKIEDILNSENSEAIEKLIEWQSLLEKE